MTEIQYAIGAACGVVVGFTLGLVGGGGSIMAVPMMVYVVGLTDAHLAIGTSALAVAVNALAGVWNHARKGNVHWAFGLAFAGAGVIGATGGSALGRLVDGQKLLFLFALLMLLVAFTMCRGRNAEGVAGVTCNRRNLPKVLAGGLATGTLSGFFGIGGGFLIVPVLIATTGMPIFEAIGTSLVPVTAFGLTTAATYALAGLLVWPLALSFIAGGLAGSVAGEAAARHLAVSRGRLAVLFAIMIELVAIYMLARTWSAFAH